MGRFEVKNVINKGKLNFIEQEKICVNDQGDAQFL